MDELREMKKNAQDAEIAKASAYNFIVSAPMLSNEFAKIAIKLYIETGDYEKAETVAEDFNMKNTLVYLLKTQSVK